MDILTNSIMNIVHNIDISLLLNGAIASSGFLRVYP